MTAVVSRTAAVSWERAGAPWLTGLAGARAKMCEMGQRVMACAAAAVMIGSVGAALLQLTDELLSFPVPIAAAAITLMAATLLHSLRRHLRIQARRRPGQGTPA
jgi:hypothetical protein